MVTQCTLTVDIALQYWVAVAERTLALAAETLQTQHTVRHNCRHCRHCRHLRISADDDSKENICHIFCDRQTCAELDL